MNDPKRNEKILLDIVEEYIYTAEPVSSQQLLKKYKYNLSSATIRNIMAELDTSDFLYQPHTSAGRIPTKKAYIFFVDKVELGLRTYPKKKRQVKKVSPEFKKDLNHAMHTSSDEVARMLSQYLAETTGSMAFVGLLSINHFYREGLKYLLDEPEFVNTETIRSLVEYADSLEARIDKLFKSIEDTVRVYVGDFENANHSQPFSLMAFRSKFFDEEKAVFGIIGPMRMHYCENMELLNSIRSLFEEN